MKDYTDLSKYIIEHVGGKDNVISLTHCVTRLRFKLKDESKADTDALKNKEGILNVVQKGGQYQVVIGNSVEDVYDRVMKIGGFKSAALGKEEQQKGIFNSFISIISGIFTPLLGLMCGCGIIKGLSVFFSALGLISTTSGTYIIINSIGDTIFYFFPVFIGYTAANKFGMNKFVGAAIGASLIHPNIAALNSAETLFTVLTGTMFETNVTTTFLGIPVLLMSYSSTVIPAILATYVASKFEVICKKIIPDVFKMFLVPAITLVCGVIVTILAVGPIATWLSDIIGYIFISVHEFSPVITGVLVGGLWQVLVMFGIHQGLMPIMINNIIANGFENVICCMQPVPFVTFAVVLAVYFKTKNSNLRKAALPASISSFFGVSEPSIYGITLPLKTPFINTLIASAIGGGLMGFFGSTMYTMGGLGIFAFPAYINPNKGFDISFFGTLIAVGVAMIIGFVITYITYKDKSDSTEEKIKESEKNEELLKQEIFVSPVKGNVVPLDKLNDEVFSSGAAGKGVGIKPIDGKVYAPADGEVTMVFETGHAIALTTASNSELLIHIGIDTVELNGEGFKKHVKKGDKVKKGDLLISFDPKIIEEKGYDDTVILLVTNSDQFLDVIVIDKKVVDLNDELLAVAV